MDDTAACPHAHPFCFAFLREHIDRGQKLQAYQIGKQSYQANRVGDCGTAGRHQGQAQQALQTQHAIAAGTEIAWH